jgi:hypothetical protein
MSPIWMSVKNVEAFITEMLNNISERVLGVTSKSADPFRTCTIEVY